MYRFMSCHQTAGQNHDVMTVNAGHVARMGKVRIYIKFQLENVKTRDHLEDLRIHERKVLAASEQKGKVAEDSMGLQT